MSSNKIADVIEGMDAEHIHKTMKRLDWTWVVDYDSENNTVSKKTPSAVDITLYLMKILERCKQDCLKGNHKEYSVDSGGFYCTYYAEDENGEEAFEAFFYISRACSAD